MCVRNVADAQPREALGNVWLNEKEKERKERDRERKEGRERKSDANWEGRS